MEMEKPDMSHINENSFSRWIIEKSNGLTTVGLRKYLKRLEIIHI